MEAWQKPETFALWLAIALLVVLLLVLSIVLFTRLYYKRIQEEQSLLAETKLRHHKDLLQSSALVQETERQRIASDLHDALIPQLSSLLFIENFPEAFKTRLQSSIQLARGISHDLSPPLLEESGLAELIEEFIHPFQAEYEIELYTSMAVVLTIPATDKLQLFRIVQEVVHNIVKHALADRICIYLRQSMNYCCVHIKDNGKGFDPDSVKTGLGMKSIEFRASVLSANYRFKKMKNGTSFTLCYALTNKRIHQSIKETGYGKN